MIDGIEILKRMERAVERVRERLLRVTSLLNAAGIDYAVAGGHAVAAWVCRRSTKRPSATRETWTSWFGSATSSEFAPYSNRRAIDTDTSPASTCSSIRKVRRREAVQLVPANHRTDAGFELPGVEDSVRFGAYSVLTLEALVKSKLIANRDKDRVHLRDMISLGLIDETWPARFEPALGSRLQALLDDPNG